MRRITAACVLVVAMALLVRPGWAQPAGDSRSWPQSVDTAAGQILKGEYWLNWLRIPYELVRAPVDWSLGDWGKAALVGLGVAGLMVFDPDIQEFVQDDLRSDFTDELADKVTGFGEFNIMWPAMGGGYLLGSAIGSRRLAAASLVGLQSVLIAAPITDGIKFLSRRARPNTTVDSFDFAGPSGAGNRASFPSGHATHAFAVATAFAMEFDDSWVVPPLAYGIASLTAFARVNDNRHWTSDVVIGAGVGFVVGVLAHKLSPFGSGPDNVSVRPLVDGDTKGVLVSLRF